MNSAEIPLDVDDLPPPPPEMIYLPPSSLKKPLCPTTPVRKPSYTKRISFDDDVQVINAGNISQKQLTSGQQLISGQAAAAAESHYSGFPDNHERNIYSAAGNGQQLISGQQQLTSGHLTENNQIYSFHARQPYNASPKKLFTEESNCQAAPPKTFLQDLQKVMSKKWQVAEKCRADGTSVHHVYGFRYVLMQGIIVIDKMFFTLGPFKYYVIKEVGGWGLKMVIFDDLQFCKSSKRWMGLKKSKI